jgi:hypothetical protein
MIALCRHREPPVTHRGRGTTYCIRLFRPVLGLSSLSRHHRYRDPKHVLVHPLARAHLFH